MNYQGQIGQPREFFGFRDVDLLHDWKSDYEYYQLVPDLETFIAAHKQLNAAETIDAPEVLPEMLNREQRAAYDYIIGGFRQELRQHSLNTIVMGAGGVGKSFLIRALENGIWQAAKKNMVKTNTQQFDRL